MPASSGIATATRAWADVLDGTKAKVRDTRKTTPGLRALEKFAVRCGGGVNHRMSLCDAALIKDNHVVAAGGVAAAFTAVRNEFPGVPIEVEVDRIDQIPPILAEGADLILLDNFTPEQTREAVALVAYRAMLESSGRLRPSTTPAPTPRPASTTSRWARSPTPPQSSTSASTCTRTTGRVAGARPTTCVRTADRHAADH